MLKLPVLIAALVITVAAIIKLSIPLGVYAAILWLLGLFFFQRDF
jgi:hypothetical protein